MVWPASRVRWELAFAMPGPSGRRGRAGQSWLDHSCQEGQRKFAGGAWRAYVRKQSKRKVGARNLSELAATYAAAKAEQGDEFELHGVRLDGRLTLCENIADHLVGNTYCKFENEEDAQDCYEAMNGRFYNGRPINVEFSPVTDFREARCRQCVSNTRPRARAAPRRIASSPGCRR